MYASVMTPSELPVNFEIEVRNNNATMVGAGYRVDWSVYRLGLLIDTESDLFPTSIPLGSTSPTGKNYPRYTFNPASIDGIIIGNYIIKATLTNTLNEVVDERTWSVNVNHPSLPKITSRNLYAGSSSPSWN